MGFNPSGTSVQAVSKWAYFNSVGLPALTVASFQPQIATAQLVLGADDGSGTFSITDDGSGHAQITSAVSGVFAGAATFFAPSAPVLDGSHTGNRWLYSIGLGVGSTPALNEWGWDLGPVPLGPGLGAVPGSSVPIIPVTLSAPGPLLNGFTITGYNLQGTDSIPIDDGALNIIIWNLT